MGTTLVDSTSPRRGEKASYYSSVCLETGEVEVMELASNRSQPPPRTPMRGSPLPPPSCGNCGRDTPNH